MSDTEAGGVDLEAMFKAEGVETIFEFPVAEVLRAMERRKNPGLYVDEVYVGECRLSMEDAGMAGIRDMVGEPSRNAEEFVSDRPLWVCYGRGRAEEFGWFHGDKAREAAHALRDGLRDAARAMVEWCARDLDRMVNEPGAQARTTTDMLAECSGITGMLTTTPDAVPTMKLGEAVIGGWWAPHRRTAHRDVFRAIDNAERIVSHAVLEIADSVVSDDAKARRAILWSAMVRSRESGTE